MECTLEAAASIAGAADAATDDGLLPQGFTSFSDSHKMIDFHGMSKFCCSFAGPHHVYGIRENPLMQKQVLEFHSGACFPRGVCSGGLA